MLGSLLLAVSPALATEFSEPWKRADRALVIDAYEYNSIDWHKLVGDKRITGFINKASDGLPPDYYCKGDDTEVQLCRALWKRHAVARELFLSPRTVDMHLRRILARLDCRTRAEAVARAGAQGLLD